jgi:TonB family protein
MIYHRRNLAPECAAKMKMTAVLFTFLLLFRAVGQDSAPPRPGEGHSQYCRGDETDSADCITHPRPIYSPDPEYPVKERKTGHEGKVILRLLIDPDGVTHDITVSDSLSPAFDAAAVEAVQKWKFSPATKNGKQVPVHIVIQIDFHTTRRK